MTIFYEKYEAAKIIYKGEKRIRIMEQPIILNWWLQRENNSRLILLLFAYLDMARNNQFFNNKKDNRWGRLRHV